MQRNVILTAMLVALAYSGMLHAQQVQPMSPPQTSQITAPDIDPVSKDVHRQHATIKSQTQPEYPLAEACNRIGGTVVLLVTIDKNGDPIDVTVEHTSHDRFLDRAAIDALKSWKFNPALENGSAVNDALRVPFNFNPSSRPSGCPKQITE